MPRPVVPLAFALAAFLSAPLAAQGLGDIGTVERGRYACELPGDASGTVGLPQPDEDFEIASASRYRSAQGSGTYLRRGDVMTMTSGPRNGTRYAVVSNVLLEKYENGQPGRLRCLWRQR
jgi:hypothetical protein